jgi:acylphosphatase
LTTGPTDRAAGAVRRRIRITGRVQGVWFRAGAARQADRLGVGGFARNERDGSVTVEAEGAPAAVEAMIAWCRVGPPRAEVVGVTVEDVTPTGSPGFAAR